MTRPINCIWTGHEFAPAGDYHLAVAARDYEDGKVYRLAPVEDRSWSSHKHQFAWIREAWNSLPESLAGEPWAQSPEHLRKYALIKSGFCDCRSVACGSNAAALRVAAVCRELDEYALASVEGSSVSIFTAQSQSARAMGKARFHESKEGVLRVIADLIGVDPDTLERQEQAA